MNNSMNGLIDEWFVIYGHLQTNDWLVFLVIYTHYHYHPHIIVLFDI